MSDRGMSPARQGALRELVRRHAADVPVRSCASSHYTSGAGMVNRLAARTLVAEGLALERLSPLQGGVPRFEVTGAGLLAWERLCKTAIAAAMPAA